MDKNQDQGYGINIPDPQHCYGEVFSSSPNSLTHTATKSLHQSEAGLAINDFRRYLSMFTAEKKNLN
jgi:hypothetical protein